VLAGVRGYEKEEIGEKVGREKDKNGDGFPQISLECVRSISERYLLTYGAEPFFLRPFSCALVIYQENPSRP
jgi:hypothetical protein